MSFSLMPSTKPLHENSFEKMNRINCSEMKGTIQYVVVGSFYNSLKMSNNSALYYCHTYVIVACKHEKYTDY